MQQGAVPPERAQEVLDGVLGRTEFQEPETYGMQLMREVLEWFGDLFSGIGGSIDPALVEGGLRVLWILAVALSGLGLVSYALALWRSRSPRAARGEGEGLDALDLRVAELRREARRAQEAGERTRALRLYFLALVVGLGARGELDYDDAWTNRELLERGHPSPEVRRLLAPLVGELDAHSFGGRPTADEEVRRFALLCERMLDGGAA